MSDTEYSIEELCQHSGIPRRTIHFYVQQGLLPSPRSAGVGARYGVEHLLRLQLIPRLRDQGLRLDDIRDRLAGLDTAALQALVDQTAAPLSVTPAFLSTSQVYQHYELPAGMTLVVPATLRPADRQRLAELLREVQRIFSVSSVPDPFSKGDIS